MNTPSKQSDIQQIIATYLEGLHNPHEDGLYNELRAQRDTENLKAAIEAYAQQEVNKVLSELKEKLPEKEYMHHVYEGAENPEDCKRLNREITAIRDSVIDRVTSAIESYMKGDLKS